MIKKKKPARFTYMTKEFPSGDFMAIAGAVHIASWDGWRLVAARDQRSNYGAAELRCQLFFERPFRQGDG